MMYVYVYLAIGAIIAFLCLAMIVLFRHKLDGKTRLKYDYMFTRWGKYKVLIGLLIVLTVAWPYFIYLSAKGKK